MALASIQGEWCLVASGSVNSEIAFINDEEPDPNGVSDWLNGIDDTLVDTATATSGLTLSIASDGTFAEHVSGKPEVDWFDAEGILQAEVSPFNGVVVGSDQAVYLRPINIATWASPVEGRYGRAVLRYDDGDTKISDRIRALGDRLIRTVNVVTDELYLDRVVIVYERVG
jgi:hypothetical protein